MDTKKTKQKRNGQRRPTHPPPPPPPPPPAAAAEAAPATSSSSSGLKESIMTVISGRLPTSGRFRGAEWPTMEANFEKKK